MRFGRVRHDDERGQVAIVVALTLTLMLAFGALIVDVGLNWAGRSEVQSAADAAALAGAAKLPGSPDEAVALAKAYLFDNIPGLADPPGWEGNGTDADGDITCYRPPAPVPAPGAHGCQVGDTAIQVITPPLRPSYAFASILGRSSNEVKALAAAGATPGATAPCALCVLSTDQDPALVMNGTPQVSVEGAGVVVNSGSDIGNGSLTASNGTGSIGVAGNAQQGPQGQYSPAPTRGISPIADPLSSLPAPNQLNPPVLNGPIAPLFPGVYETISVSGGVTRRLQPGIYVIKGGISVSGGATLLASGVTLYLTCDSYPLAPCNGTGAGLDVSDGGRLVLTAPVTTGPAAYRNLAIFFDRTNTAGLDIAASAGGSRVTGTIYAPSATLELGGDAATRLDSMTVVGAMSMQGGAQASAAIVYQPSQNVAVQAASGGLIK